MRRSTGQRQRRAAGASPSWPSARCCTRRWQAAEALDATVANMRFVKPLDVELVLELARTPRRHRHRRRRLRDGRRRQRGGRGLAAAGIALPLLQLGLPDRFIEHGDPAKLLAMCGLDAAGIEQSVRKRFGSRLALVRPAANH